MKDILTDAITKKLAATLESLGGAKALYGDPINFNGEQVVPVAKVSIVLSADAEGSGSGNAGLGAALGNLAKGGGGGNAGASIRVNIEPVGFLRAAAGGPVFCPLNASDSASQ